MLIVLSSVNLNTELQKGYLEYYSFCWILSNCKKGLYSNECKRLIFFVDIVYKSVKILKCGSHKKNRLTLAELCALINWNKDNEAITSDLYKYQIYLYIITLLKVLFF